MMNYVEYRRAVGAIRIAAIICGIALLIAIVARVTVHGEGPNMLGDLENSPTAHVTRTTLPDGTQRTVVDDPVRKIHAVSTVRGTHFRIDITQPAKGRAGADSVNVANVSMHDATKKNGMEHLVVENDRPSAFSIGTLFITSIVMGFIIASLLGGVLAKENDGHLEVAWTKPISRERFAMTAFAVDAAAIIASQLMWIVIVIIAVAMFHVLAFSWQAGAGWIVAMTFLGPLAWYAAITGWSASVKRGPGIVMGLGWPIALAVPGGAAALSQASHPLLVALHALLLGLSYIDPLAYIHPGSQGAHVRMSAEAVQLGVGAACACLAALIVFYLALAVAQWRRVEA